MHDLLAMGRFSSWALCTPSLASFLSGIIPDSDVLLHTFPKAVLSNVPSAVWSLPGGSVCTKEATNQNFFFLEGWLFNQHTTSSVSVDWNETWDSILWLSNSTISSETSSYALLFSDRTFSSQAMKGCSQKQNWCFQFSSASLAPTLLVDPAWEVSMLSWFSKE